MLQRISAAVERFGRLPIVSKVIVGWVSLSALVAVGGCGVVMVSAAISGISNEDAAKQEEEEVASDEWTPENPPEPEPPPPPRPEPLTPEKKPSRPQPRTPEEKVRANVEDLGMFRRLEAGDPQKVWVDFYNDNGCLDVMVTYRTSEPLLGILTQAVTTEGEMERIYEAIHADRETHEVVCDVTVAAYGDPADDYGQTTDENLYQTTISRDTARRVNWSNVGEVNFRRVWRVDYIHPEVEEEEVQRNEREVLDCAHDRDLLALAGHAC